MKKLFYLFIVQIAILQSCVDQASDDIDYTIFNQTNKTIKILAFDTRNESTGVIYTEVVKANKILINPNSKFVVTRFTGLDNTTSMSFYSLEQGGVDSIRVVFNNKKVKIYTRNPPNICDLCDGDDNHQYFITEEDYETAKDCNGNCE